MDKKAAAQQHGGKVRYLMVKNWSELQQYKDRDPKWIKLYRDLLDDYDFELLDELQQLNLIKIWLLAAKLDNKIPYNVNWITKKIGAREKVELKQLFERGFLCLYNSVQICTDDGKDCTDDKIDCTDDERACTDDKIDCTDDEKDCTQRREEKRREETETETEKEKSVKKEKSQPDPKRSQPLQRKREAEKPAGVTEEVWLDFKALRRAKKAPLTKTALNGIRNQAKKAGIDLQEALEFCVTNGCQGFRSHWYTKNDRKKIAADQTYWDDNKEELEKIKRQMGET